MKYTPKITIQTIDREGHRLQILASSGDATRNRTILLNSAFDLHMQSLLDNPSFQWSHSWLDDPARSGPLASMGVIESIETTPTGVLMWLKYAYSSNPWARVDFDAIAAEECKPAFSIGFYPIVAVTRTSPAKEIEALPAYARQALESGEVDAVCTEAELVEVSRVLVGADKKAVALAAEADSSFSEGHRLLLETFGIARKGATQMPDSQPNSNVPQNGAQAQMPVKILDIATRFCALGDCIRACEWYDWKPEQRIQTVDETRAVVAQIDADLGDLRAQAEAEMAAEEATDAMMMAQSAPVAQAGKRLSADTREKVKCAMDKIQGAMDHLTDLLGDDEEEQSQAAVAQSATAGAEAPAEDPAEEAPAPAPEHDPEAEALDAMRLLMGD